MRVFWEQGYEGASLTDLTNAMGITRTSMYAAFGNKEDLFRKALERYTEGPASYGAGPCEEPTAHGRWPPRS
jgi:AcrR family transcriptional regulator